MKKEISKKFEVGNWVKVDPHMVFTDVKRKKDGKRLSPYYISNSSLDVGDKVRVWTDDGIGNDAERVRLDGVVKEYNNEGKHIIILEISRVIR